MKVTLQDYSQENATLYHDKKVSNDDYSVSIQTKICYSFLSIAKPCFNKCIQVPSYQELFHALTKQFNKEVRNQ